MPIQITELTISVSVNQPGTTSQQINPPSAQGPDSHESMVEECVAQVIKILNDKKER